MLSDVEKKSIEYCKYTIDLANRLDEVIINLRKEPVIKILNLIEKQSKEIEEYRQTIISKDEEIEELNSDLEVFKRALTDIEVVYNKNYISKDKIRAIIKEELPGDEIMETCQNYDINGVLIREKLKELLEE